MKSIVFGLALASVASAQSVLGVSMVTLDTASTSSDASSSSAYYGSAAPAQYTGATSSSGYVPPSMYTQAPSTASATDMSYSSFTAGGYSSMNCGYGYAKAYDGSCQMQSWVCASALNRKCLKLTKHYSSTPSQDVMRPSSSTSRVFFVYPLPQA